MPNEFDEHMEYEKENPAHGEGFSDLPSHIADSTSAVVRTNTPSSATVHRCPYCPKSYSRRDTCARHVSTHKGKSHECKGCGRYFKRSDHMKKHQTKCDKVVKERAMVPMRHIQTWHAGEIAVCGASLDVLYEPTESDFPAQLDLVAVHGLGGGPYSTWGHAETNALWLRDLLPKDFPHMRTMTFGYSQRAWIDTIPGSYTLAYELLRHLQKERAPGYESPNHLYWAFSRRICH